MLSWKTNLLLLGLGLIYPLYMFLKDKKQKNIEETPESKSKKQGEQADE